MRGFESAAACMIDGIVDDLKIERGAIVLIDSLTQRVRLCLRPDLIKELSLYQNPRKTAQRAISVVSGVLKQFRYTNQ